MLLVIGINKQRGKELHRFHVYQYLFREIQQSITYVIRLPSLDTLISWLYKEVVHFVRLVGVSPLSSYLLYLKVTFLEYLTIRSLTRVLISHLYFNLLD